MFHITDKTILIPWTVLGITFLLGLLLLKIPGNQSANISQVPLRPTVVISPPSNSFTVLPASSSAREKIITQQEVSQHNIKESCWVIVDKKVYDITLFVASTKDLLEICGKDGSLIFSAIQKTYGSQYGSMINSLMNQYQVGTTE